MLLRQGLAIRGHEEIEGNLMQLLLLRAQDKSELKRFISDQKYMSPEIVNECIRLMGQSLLRTLLKEIQEARYFAILADETRDINNKEQLVLCIRWVDSSFITHEDMIGLVQVDKTDSNTLCSAIKDVLIRCCLPLSQC
jgi:hypothetical protein